MGARDYTGLLAELEEAYALRSPVSRALHERAGQTQVDGGSHTLRLIAPFPPRIVAARGAWLRDEDGHEILDFWQGHLANILGHSPGLVTSTLASAFESGSGLQTGFTERLQIETAEIFCRQTGAERVRFTTSGTLATMYSIMLSRAYTGRSLIMKVGGGWHGAQPWALKGIEYHPPPGKGFQGAESAGVPSAEFGEVIITRFNDTEGLQALFREFGDRVACFILEPFLGVGGMAPATHEWLRAARQLTNQYGAVLVFDEVISGFRFRAGDLGALYGLQPDLATFGKIVGGGMPVAAVAGRQDILELAGRESRRKVRFSGGTYSAHPASLLAAKTIMSHLAEHESEVYPRLARLGEKVRSVLTAGFRAEGIHVHCTGDGESALCGSSMFMLHFPYSEHAALRGPEDWLNPARCNTVLRRSVLTLAFLVEGVFIMEGHGAATTAHAAADIDFLNEACRRVARRIKPYL
jgi:glutamate-1-semialdehyde 2,1-aminomutase